MIAQNMGTKIGLIEHIYFVIFCAGCEGGEGSAVDGKPAGARVGQEGKVSRDGISKCAVLLCFNFCICHHYCTIIWQLLRPINYL